MKFSCLALDPATHTGWAHTNGASGVWDLSILRDESDGMRLIRLRSKLNEIFAACPFDLLVYEAARHAMPKMQGALVTQAQLQGIIKLWCQDNNVQYRGYSPSEIKKHATGSGNANKDTMIRAAKMEFDVKIISDDHADALWLLSLATSTYGNEQAKATEKGVQATD